MSRSTRYRKPGPERSAPAGLSMLLIASVLLNAPAIVGALGGGGGPGEPPAGIPSRGPGGNEGGAAARFDGCLSAVIEFPFTGGFDDRLGVVLPEQCVVLNATVQLDGSSALPPAKDRLCTFADTESNRAYDGVSEDSPPTGGPGNFQANQFGGSSYSAVSRQDGSFYETMTWGFGSPYHLFKFKVTENVVTSLTVKYVGAGYDWLFMSTDLQLYIYNSGRWTNIGGHSAMGPDSSLVTIKKTISSPAGCVDSNGWVSLLAMGPDGWIFSFLDTDYIELTVKGSDYVWPSNLALDLGADGVPEAEYPGALRGTTVYYSDMLRSPLQAFVDAIAEEGGSVYVPLRLRSATGGVLTVRGLVEIDLPPVLSPIPPERLRLDEDTAAWALVDLDGFCKDDRDRRPAYEIFQKPSDGKVECALNVSGHHLDIWTTAANWSGTREFGLRATDQSGLSAEMFFNVTVVPVNDPPVLFPVADQTAYEDQPFTLALRAFDIDDPPANLTFADDFPLADFGPWTGVLSFTPTNGQVGRYPINVTVNDSSGASAAIFFWLLVENVNDPPMLFCDEELFATEDRPFEYEPSASDIDAGDSLRFSLESDIFGLEADPETGRIEFTFENEHVGEHRLELSVKDKSGEVDSRDILLTVENVNDPPVLEQDVQLFAIEDEEFEYRINASDEDRGDGLTFSIDAGFLELDERTGDLSFTPGDEHVGRHKLAVTVTDRSGVSVSARYVLVVENVNDPPSRLEILTPRSGAELREGSPVMLSATAFDPDAGEVLNFTWKEGRTVLGRGANLSAALRPGRHLVTLEVSDGKVNGTVDVQFTVLKAETSGGGLLGMLMSAGLPLALLLAAVIAAVLVSRKGGKGSGRPGPGPSPPGYPPLPHQYQPPGPPPPSGMDRPPYYPPGSQPGYAPVAQQPPAGAWQAPQNDPGQQNWYPPAPGQQPGFQPAPQQLAPAQWQPPNPGAYHTQPAPQYQPRQMPTLPDAAPPYMDRPHLQPPFARVPEGQPQASPRPTVAGPKATEGRLGTEDLPQSYRSSVAPARNAGNGAGRESRAAAAQAEPEEPPFAIPLDGGPEGPASGPARAGPARPGGPPPPEDPPGPDDGPGPDGPEEPPAPRPRNGGRRRGDDGVVSRNEMRAAMSDARYVISAARAAGLNPSDCDRLLSEAMAASYRLDYVRAKNLARRSESVALSLLERSAREEEREHEPLAGGDDEPPEEVNGETA